MRSQHFNMLFQILRNKLIDTFNAKDSQEPQGKQVASLSLPQTLRSTRHQVRFPESASLMDQTLGVVETVVAHQNNHHSDRHLLVSMERS